MERYEIQADHVVVDFQRVELASITKDQAMALCQWNDPNGCWTDADNMAEFGAPMVLEDYTRVIREWMECCAAC